MNKVSVITVNYNNSKGLEHTIKSVLSQSYNNVEYLIIDGGSTDDVELVMDRFVSDIDFFVSQQDAGVYDAMNKGITNSTGDWLLFLNSGDIFANNDVLSDIFSIADLSNYSVVFGDKINKIDNEVVKAGSVLDLKVGEMFACHQSMLFRKSNIRYDLSYSIYGDYDYVCKYFKTFNGSFLYLGFPFSVYEGGGISSVVSSQKRKDKYRSVYLNFGFPILFKSLLFRLKKFL